MAFGGTKSTSWTITREVYDRLVELWTKGDRTIAALHRASRLNPVTCSRVVNKGIPTRGFPPLKEKAREYDEVRKLEEQRAHLQAARAAVDQTSRARSERLSILRLAKSGYANLFKAWTRDTAGAVFTKEEGTQGMVVEVKDVEGNTKQVPAASAHLMALTGARLVQGWSTFSELEEQALKLADDPQELGLPQGTGGVPPGLAGLTQEQLDYVTKTGNLPPDVSIEQVFGIKPGPAKGN